MRIFLDENLSEFVADALNSLNKGYFPGLKVVSTKNEIKRGAADEEIIPIVGKEHGVVVTKDKSIKKGAIRARLFLENKTSIIILIPPKDSSYWFLARFLINHWQEIVHTCNHTKHPFAFSLTKRGGIVPFK